MIITIYNTCASMSVRSMQVFWGVGQSQHVKNRSMRKPPRIPNPTAGSTTVWTGEGHRFKVSHHFRFSPSQFVMLNQSQASHEESTQVPCRPWVLQRGHNGHEEDECQVNHDRGLCLGKRFFLGRANEASFIGGTEGNIGWWWKECIISRILPPRSSLMNWLKKVFEINFSEHNFPDGPVTGPRRVWDRVWTKYFQKWWIQPSWSVLGRQPSGWSSRLVAVIGPSWRDDSLQEMTKCR